MASILDFTITGMTCPKCEKLIKDGVTDVVPEITKVDVDRLGGTAKIHINLPQNNPTLAEERKAKIIQIINALVNGKFKATIVQG
jgi:copper chaperone CopZ